MACINLYKDMSMCLYDSYAVCNIPPRTYSNSYFKILVKQSHKPLSGSFLGLISNVSIKIS
jgi:hypothetical protein